MAGVELVVDAEENRYPDWVSGTTALAELLHGTPFGILDWLV
jgi:hypothetical protein